MGQNAQLIFIWYLLFMLGIFVAVAIIHAMQARISNWSVSEEKLCRCPDCHLTFIVPSRQWFAKCPRCARKCRVEANRK